MDIITYGALLNKAKPTDAQVAQAVDSWLDDHPEATTTVQDGAITYAKLNSDLKNSVDDVTNLKSEIGDLSNLTTTAKSNLVAAINEAAQSGGGSSAPYNLLHICAQNEYDNTTLIPTIAEPNESIIYLVPSGNNEDLYAEWVYINENWEPFGNVAINLTGYVKNTDYATNNVGGVIKLGQRAASGLSIGTDGKLFLSRADISEIKEATSAVLPIVPAHQHESVFFGLAKAAGDSTQSESNNSVGNYTNDAKAAIKNMLGISDAGDIEYDDTGTYASGTVGASIADLKSASPSVETPEETEADLYICDSDGNVIAKFVDGHIVTKNFDSGAIQLDLIMGVNSDAADMYIADSFGNVIAEFKNGGIVTKNFDSGDYANVLVNINTLLSDVSDLQTATSGILYRTKDQTDGVYATCRWHQPTPSDKQFCMLISGDIHTDPTRMLNIIEYLNAIDAFDAGVMLGDMSGDTFDSPITHYTDAIVNTQKPFLTVLGNHDVVGATSDAQLWTKYGALFDYADLSNGEAVEGKCYYYKDFNTYKIRIIVLMQYDYTYTGDLCFGQSQIDWLISTLNSTPLDYGVIIAEHTNPSRYMTYNMNEEYTSSTWAQSNYAPTDMGGDPIPDIVNAWINGSTLTQTYNYTFDNSPSPLSVSADFTARGAGEFITYLGGHWHMDVLGTPTGYTDQPDYHVPAAGLNAVTQGDIPRKTETVSEDSFCVMAVDRNKKTVKIFHIGAHYTKDAVDRQYFKYNYGGANA